MYQSNSLYPNKFNITNDEQIPIAIELAYFLEDSTQDSSKLNRYYFKFPADWITSNRGESIIGVRNIFMVPRRRKLEFNLGIRKYYREDYNRISRAHPEYGLDLVYDSIDEERKSETSFNVISWLPSDKDLREVFKDLTEDAEAQFDVVNTEINEFNSKHQAQYIYDIDKEITELSNQSSNLTKEVGDLDTEIEELQEQYVNETDSTEKENLRELINQKQSERIEKRLKINELSTQMEELEEKKKKEFKPLFIQENRKRRKRDIQMDGYYSYERNCFIEVLESPANKEPKDMLDAFNKEEYKYYVDLRINFRYRPADDKSLQDESFDFADVMNIGYGPFQNQPEKYLNIFDEVGSRGKWLRKIEFENVWDRHSCKIYSSIAEESSKGYLGNSQIFYQPIKYFKLNSTDQTFWIEFYSGRFHKIPIKIPLNESFNIELVFHPFNKLLYV